MTALPSTLQTALIVLSVLLVLLLSGIILLLLEHRRVLRLRHKQHQQWEMDVSVLNGAVVSLNRRLECCTCTPRLPWESRRVRRNPPQPPLPPYRSPQNPYRGVEVTRRRSLQVGTPSGERVVSMSFPSSSEEMPSPSQRVRSRPSPRFGSRRPSLRPGHTLELHQRVFAPRPADGGPSVLTFRPGSLSDRVLMRQELREEDAQAQAEAEAEARRTFRARSPRPLAASDVSALGLDESSAETFSMIDLSSLSHLNYGQVAVEPQQLHEVRMAVNESPESFPRRIPRDSSGTFGGPVSPLSSPGDVQFPTIHFDDEVREELERAIRTDPRSNDSPV